MSEKLWDLYFLPGQIIFHVTEEFNGDPTPLIEWANRLASSFYKDNNITGDVSVTAPSVMNFKPPENSSSSNQVRSISKAYVQPSAEQQWKLPSLASILGIFKQIPSAKPPPPFSLVSANVESSRWPKFKAYDYDKELNEQEKQKKALNEQFDLIKFLDKN